jgi:RNA polymerase sigma-70 factor (ECF subfamily)
MRMETGDEALVAAARAGDGPAFGALVSRHYGAMFRLAWRVLGNRAEAEDVVQDVCAALARKLALWRGEARFSTWLARVVINAARDHIRRNASRRRAAEGWGAALPGERAEAEARKEDLAWLAAAMAALGPDLRETLALVLGEEMSHREAGEVLGLSEGTVSWRMSEVRRLLKARAAAEGMVP